jgi:hypothetical protein
MIVSSVYLTAIESPLELGIEGLRHAWLVSILLADRMPSNAQCLGGESFVKSRSARWLGGETPRRLVQ